MTSQPASTPLAPSSSSTSNPSSFFSSSSSSSKASLPSSSASSASSATSSARPVAPSAPLIERSLQFTSPPNSLHRACQQGDLNKVNTFLSNPDAKLNVQDPTGATPFFLACQNGHYKVVYALAHDPRVDLNLPNHKGFNPFFTAVCEKRLDVVRLLLQSPRVDPDLAIRPSSTATEVMSPFIVACIQKNMEMLDLLLRAQSKVDPNRKFRDNTILFFACANNMTQLVRLLLRYPHVKHDSRNTTGITPLWVACKRGNIQVVKELIASRRKFDLSVTPYGSVGTPAISCFPHHLVLFNLMAEFLSDTEFVREDTRKELGTCFLDDDIAEIYVAGVFVTDGYFRVKATEETSKGGRYYKMVSRLPVELQMILANMGMESTKTSVLTKNSEPAFRRVIWYLRGTDKKTPAVSSSSSSSSAVSSSSSPVVLSSPVGGALENKSAGV